ncbi:MAG: glycosyltransferase, partial [Patescibacteria group bacterium]
MKILIISIDKGLLGRDQLGDVVKRHQKYSEFTERLDVVVFSRPGYEPNVVSDRMTVYPTNSKNRLSYLFDGLRLGKKLFLANHYDLIITQEPFVTALVGYRLKKKFKARLLIHFHGDFWNNSNWLKESRFNFIFLAISK